MRHLAAAVLLATATLPALASAQDWTAYPLGTSANINVIEHTSFSGRFIVGDGGTVFQSDGSRTVWTPIDVGTSADLLAVQQSSLGGPWVAGDAGVVRVHTSGTWFHRDIPHASEDFVLFTGGSGTSYATGTGGSIYRTVNSGALWTLQSSGTTNALHDGAGGATAYCVGDNGTILKTTDTGVTWIAKPSGTTRHLYAFRSAGGGVLLAGGEDGTLQILPEQVRIPDVSVMLWESLPGQKSPTEPVPGLAPDLAIEVISEGNTKKEMERKMRDYFEAGVKMVWYIYPKTQSAEVYTAPTKRKKVTAGQSLRGGDLLPGFELPLKKLFERVAKSHKKK
jgi:Uma2 family endonuclease